VDPLANSAAAPVAAAPQAPQAVASPSGPADGVLTEGLVQGSPHPGEMTPPPSGATPTATPTQAANNAAVNAALNQLPAGQASPESAALNSSARAMAAQMGFAQANQFQDDKSFMEALLGQAQQAQAAQAQLQNVQNYQAALAQAQAMAQQQRQAAAAPAPKALNAIWNPPEFNPQWNSLVRNDEKGVPTLIPGAPAEILPKFLAYQQYRQNFAEKFLSNPEETLMPLINATADERAREMVRKEIDARQEQHYIQSFVQDNSAWLHAKDNQGQVLRNQNGQPVLSPAGQRFQQYVAQATNSGIVGVRQQEEYARTYLQRDILVSQQNAAAQAGASHQAVVDANRRPNMAGMTVQPGVAPPPSVGSSLAQQLQSALQAHGITDTDTY